MIILYFNCGPSNMLVLIFCKYYIPTKISFTIKDNYLSKTFGQFN